MRSTLLVATILLLMGSGYSAPRQHTILLGKWRSVEVLSDSGTAQPAKVRTLIVDGRLRDYVSGPPHDVTSEASWYRDYAAYCGASDDGSKTFMMVVQLGKRKPILKKETTVSACTAPQWERTPSRVTFVVAGEKTTFAIRGHGADLQPETAEEEGP